MEVEDDRIWQQAGERHLTCYSKSTLDYEKFATLSRDRRYLGFLSGVQNQKALKQLLEVEWRQNKAVQSIGSSELTYCIVDIMFWVRNWNCTRRVYHSDVTWSKQNGGQRNKNVSDMKVDAGLDSKSPIIHIKRETISLLSLVKKSLTKYYFKQKVKIFNMDFWWYMYILLFPMSCI